MKQKSWLTFFSETCLKLSETNRLKSLCLRSTCWKDEVRNENRLSSFKQKPHTSLNPHSSSANFLTTKVTAFVQTGLFKRY